MAQPTKSFIPTTPAGRVADLTRAYYVGQAERLNGLRIAGNFALLGTDAEQFVEYPDETAD